RVLVARSLASPRLMIRARLCLSVMLVFGVASAAAGERAKLPDCPSDISARLCLTLLAGWAAQSLSDPMQRSASLIELADMQRADHRADHRADLARETLRLATVAASAIEHQYNRAEKLGQVAARRIALSDTLSLEADARTFSETRARTKYLIEAFGPAI